jgi:DNA repair protein RecO (recombination protein O)
VRRVRLYRVSAIVIRQRNLGEADRILTLYTRERGKVSAVAKGVRRSRSKLAGSLQLFSLAEVQLAAGRSLEVATQARSLDSFYNLRRDLTCYAHASYTAELLDALTDEGLPDEILFDLLSATIRALDCGADPDTIVRGFELHLLDRLGYGPELDECVSCSAPVRSGAHGFSITQGGVLCLRCIPSLGGAPLSAAGLRALRDLARLPCEELAGRRLSAPVRKELARLLRAFVDFRLERPLRSAVFLAGDVGLEPRT